MLHRPRRNKHFSRTLMGWVFLACGLLLGAHNLLAGAVFLPLALVVFYYAPRWNLRIEITPEAIRFSENVLEIHPVDLALADIARIRRMEETAERKGLLTTYPEHFPFVEFETRSGRTYRMHDIFDAEFDAEILRLGNAAGIDLADFPRSDGEEHAPEAVPEP